MAQSVTVGQPVYVQENTRPSQEVVPGGATEVTEFASPAPPGSSAATWRAFTRIVVKRLG